MASHWANDAQKGNSEVVVGDVTPPNNSLQHEREKSHPAVNTSEAYSHANQRKRHLWLWELGGIVGSLLCLAGIIALTASLDNKPLPRWSQPHDICVPRLSPQYCGKVTVSVNSIIAWLSTGAKICVLIPVTRALGQLKWIWFSENERCLSDLNKFDSAARGMVGSVMLAWTLRGRHFAVIGAFAVVLSLAFDPFIQNLITYTIVYAPSTTTGVARVANSTRYSPDTDSVHSDATVSADMKANIFAGLFNSDNQWMTPKYSCPSGNCTYSSYASLGVCAQCQDMTSALNRDCSAMDLNNNLGCNVTLGNNFTLAGNNGSVMHMSTPSDVYNVESFNYLVRPIAVIDSITAFDTFLVNDTTPVVASECALTACVRSYNAAVGGSSNNTSGSQYAETAAKTWLDYVVDDEVNTIIPIPADPELGIHEATNFTIPYATMKGLSMYISSMLYGYVLTQGEGDYEYQTDGAEIVTGSIGTTITGDMMQAIYNGNYADCATPENGNICAMQNLALAMTKAIRNEAWSNTSTSALMAAGEVLVPKTYVRVTWYWIALPLFIWILAVVMFLGTVIKTHRAGLWAWGPNPLALIFLGFDQEAQESMQDSGHGLSEKGLEKRADGLKVRLKVDGDRVIMAKEGADV